jgi:adenylate kinase family enzyme
MGIFRRGTSDLSPQGDTDLLTRPEVEEDEGSHDRFAHYIKKDKVVESAVTGKAVRALCGKKWVPSRDPEKYPICPACKAIYDSLPRKKESE